MALPIAEVTCKGWLSTEAVSNEDIAMYVYICIRQLGLRSPLKALKSQLAPQQREWIVDQPLGFCMICHRMRLRARRPGRSHS